MQRMDTSCRSEWWWWVIGKGRLRYKILRKNFLKRSILELVRNCKRTIPRPDSAPGFGNLYCEVPLRSVASESGWKNCSHLKFDELNCRAIVICLAICCVIAKLVSVWREGKGKGKKRISWIEDDGTTILITAVEEGSCT